MGRLQSGQDSRHEKQLFSVTGRPPAPARVSSGRFPSDRLTKTIDVMVLLCQSHGNRNNDGFRDMLVGYVRVSTADDRQSTDMQRDALLTAGVDERHIHEDRLHSPADTNVIRRAHTV